MVTHCLDQIDVGLVSRSVQWPTGQVEAALVDLQHGCVSCTLREDVLPTLVRMAHSPEVAGVVLVLPEAVEPMGFLEAFYSVVVGEAGRTASEHLDIDSVVAVVDTTRLIPRLTAGERLEQVGLAIGPQDDRTLAEVIVEQVETADVVVAAPAPETELSVLALLNPDARYLTTLSAGCGQHFELDRTLDRVNPSRPTALSPDAVCGGAWGFTWVSDRPFHPERLHRCLDDLGRSLRGRGSALLASRPGAVVEWDSVGSRIALGANSETEHQGVTALSFVGVNELGATLRSRLSEATLDDLEMAAGPHQWQTWPDPFDDLWNPSNETEEA